MPYNMPNQEFELKQFKTKHERVGNLHQGLVRHAKHPNKNSFYPNRFINLIRDTNNNIGVKPFYL